ncbi:MAG: amino acid dehydrogenase, partial [Alishewanella sp. 32-51-5]
MAVFNHPEFDQHEQVVFCSDQETGLKAIIAVHSTRLGPAVGGCRLWDYASDEDALVDVLRLSRGMTYKNAMAGLPLGGGKSVIIGNAKTIKSEALFKAFGRMVHRLGGSYYSAEDVNITTHDIMQVHQETPYVAGLEGKSGNPAPFTALGTYQGIKAAAKHQFGSADLAGKTVAVQGLGSVGFYLCEHLHKEGAKLIVTDINQDAVNRAVAQFGATAVGLNDIYGVAADIYAPCALGATINDDTIPQLKAKVVAGCANNQLKRPEHGQKLRDL